MSGWRIARGRNWRTWSIKFVAPHPDPLPIAPQRGEGVSRWIVIGALKANVALYGRQFGGGRRGWWLNWRGREYLFQPSEFLEIEDVAAAVRRRLALARLELLALASCPPRDEYQKLWVLVRRKTRERKT